MDSLYNKLINYSKTDAYPFHMPGHKRNTILFDKSYSIDITEINGFDDLNHPCSVFKAAMEEMADFYGSDCTYMLTGGSSCGILSAICCVCKPGDKILVSRNCHKSVYNAIMLRQLVPVYVTSQIAENESFCASVQPNEIEKKLNENKDIKAVVIVSPTYEGVLSDISEISDICHKKGSVLIVDEAHGAHLNFSDNFPASAVKCGADITIQSLHKTLPALTQCAVMHIKSTLVQRERLEEFIQVFQTSSPSYILSASVIECFLYMKNSGKALMSKYYDNLVSLRKELSEIENLKLFNPVAGCFGNVFSYDISKLVISHPCLTGEELTVQLRKYNIECEMAADSYIIAMTSLCDTKEGFNRLVNALKEISACTSKSDIIKSRPFAFSVPEFVMPPFKAALYNTEYLPYSKALNKVSAETIYIYPPGIPIITQGEKIDEAVISAILHYEKAGLEIKGVYRKSGYIKCITM